MTIASHILAGLDGTTLTSLERDLILKHKVLGFTLFKRNIESLEQLQVLTTEIKALARQAGYEILLAVDHEGGRVFRLPEPFTRIPPMRKWGEHFEETGDVVPVFELGKILASEASLAGFNLNFAPVCDLDLNEKNPIIGDRAFSTNKEIVFKLARQVILGHQKLGMFTCLKHFPGHGATSLDSHEALPIDERSESEITDLDIYPYQRLVAEGLADSIMTAHVVYPKIDKDNPATLSEIILEGILRKKLHYDGVIFSDDLLMKAIADHHGIPAAAKKFFLCGGDAALICKHPELTLETIERLEAEISQNANPAEISHLTQNLLIAQKRLKNLLAKLPPAYTAPKATDKQALLERNSGFVRSVFG